ncbi:hypothetical protein [Sphingobium sp. KCTC 72723]|uniref:hypothetical protein n=1 Tax=Sphingobium sp. KCTC 72723 TaxID=2733867 RepID=UPI00165DA43F|nr:hypothetical protein [Sphingobium sp. KCTC 72723]
MTDTLETLRAERDEADRRAGAAERHVEQLRAMLAEGQAAIAVVVAGLSDPQKRLLCRLQPHRPADDDGQDFTYVVETRGVGLDTCAALARRGIMVGGEGYSFQNRNRGYCRLTRLGLRIRHSLLIERSTA